MTEDFSLNYEFRTCCVHKLFFVLVLKIYLTQHVLSLEFSCNSMKNLLSYFGLVDGSISASEKDLPVRPSDSKIKKE